MNAVISSPSERQLVLVAGRAHPELAEAVARGLDIDLLPTTAYTFANGELYVRFGESVRGVIASCVTAMPLHEQFIDRYCRSPVAA